MTEDEITSFVKRLGGVDTTVASADSGAPEVAWGDSFFFYDPDHVGEAHRMPFTTIVTSDYEGFDTDSDLNRPGVFRLNMWVTRDTARSMFGDPSVDEVRSSTAPSYDFAALDKVMPHPIYGRQSWVCILNPGPGNVSLVETLLSEAHRLATKRHARRASSDKE